MTSKERVRIAMSHKKPDRIPAAFEAVAPVWEKLMKHYGYTTHSQVLDRFNIDILYAEPLYVSKEPKETYDNEGRRVLTSFWGYKRTEHQTTVDKYSMTTYFPLKGLNSIKQIKENYKFPNADMFDYTPITKACEKYPDKAIIIGHEGPFQVVTSLMEMDEFFMLMYDEPTVAQYILDKMSEFELAYYRKCFEAGCGKVDVLRTHDDYGTQQSLLFSMDMWKRHFKENTKKLADLAHEFGAYFMQHSCGAVAPIIPELIECGVDALEPVQKVQGLEVDKLAEKYLDKITFHGGVDTQWLLPSGTPQEVAKETEHIMRTLGKNGSYILMASQCFESDVPIENIEAIYNVSREIFV